MSSSTPIPPNRASDIKSISQAAQQQVEKVREIDPDEQARRQQLFKQMMEEDNDSDEEGVKLTASPLSPDFYFTSQSDLSSNGYDSEPIADPNRSPPPNVNQSTQPMPTDTKLPHGKKFWKKTDISDDMLPTPNITEAKKHPTSSKTPSKKEELEPSPFGAPGKKAEKPVPTKPFAKSMTKPVWEQPQIKPKKEVAETIDKSKEETSKFKKEEKKDLSKDKPMEPEYLPQYPPHIEVAAASALDKAAPILHPEVHPIFAQMVGAIVHMTQQGIMRTEVVLTNLSEKSPFYGARIEITKYSTAANAFNVKLSGSNEAVNAFNKNLPSLMNAFEQGNFNFKIQRIEAVYSTEKPVFHRREQKGGGEMGDQSKKGNR